MDKNSTPGIRSTTLHVKVTLIRRTGTMLTVYRIIPEWSDYIVISQGAACISSCLISKIIVPQNQMPNQPVSPILEPI
jgi:hypothetical protein